MDGYPEDKLITEQSVPDQRSEPGGFDGETESPARGSVSEYGQDVDFSQLSVAEIGPPDFTKRRIQSSPEGLRQTKIRKLATELDNARIDHLHEVATDPEIRKKLEVVVSSTPNETSRMYLGVITFLAMRLQSQERSLLSMATYALETRAEHHNAKPNQNTELSKTQRINALRLLGIAMKQQENQENEMARLEGYSEGYEVGYKEAREKYLDNTAEAMLPAQEKINLLEQQNASLKRNLANQKARQRYAQARLRALRESEAKDREKISKYDIIAEGLDNLEKQARVKEITEALLQYYEEDTQAYLSSLTPASTEVSLEDYIAATPLVKVSSSKSTRLFGSLHSGQDMIEAEMEKGYGAWGAIRSLSKDPNVARSLSKAAVSFEVLRLAARPIVSTMINELPLSIARKAYKACDSTLKTAILEFDSRADSFSTFAAQRIKQTVQDFVS